MSAIRCHTRRWVLAIGTSVSLLATGCAPADDTSSGDQTAGETLVLEGVTPAEGLAQLTYLTEELAPFNFEDGGIASGISIDLLETVFGKIGVDRSRMDVRIVPWADGYRAVQEESGTVLFAIARTPARESLFKWAGPFTTLTTVLYAPESSNIEIAAVEDLDQYRIGAVEASVENGLLTDLGVEPSQIVNRETLPELVQMLESGEIDLWATGDLAGRRQFLVSAKDPDAFEAVYPLSENDFYYAFSKDVPDALVNAFQQALDEVQVETDDSGVSEYDRIMYRHLAAECSRQTSADEDVVAVVDKTVAAIEESTPDTIRSINDGEAPYRDASDRDLHVRVFDSAMTNVAHAADPGLVGANYMGKADVEGTPFYDQMLAGAQEDGAGWVQFVSVDPAHPKLHRKGAYYRLAQGSDGNAYIVAGEIYWDCD